MEPKRGQSPKQAKSGRGEPPARKSGGESVPEPHEGPIDPRQTPRRDSRSEEPAGEPGRGTPDRQGGKS